jgi:hypothetical protein
MISIIQNLLYILCQNTPNTLVANSIRILVIIRNEFTASINIILGTTSKEVLEKFCTSDITTLKLFILL